MEKHLISVQGQNRRRLLELVKDLAALWGIDEQKAVSITGNVPFREATLLKLNCDKALAYLSWQSTLRYEECVRFIAEWYKAFYSGKKNADMYDLTVEQIAEYTTRAKEQDLQWTV